MTAIQLHGISKTYRAYEGAWHALWGMVSKTRMHREWIALHPLDLNISQGQVVGIVGANGAGKSTLLKLVAGMLMPSSGTLEVQGRVAALLELGTGFHPDMSGRDNIYLGASVMGIPKAQVDSLYGEIVAFAGLEDFIEQPVRTYSSGMAIRLAFSVATAVDPDILILDETLSVGDGFFAKKSFDRIIRYKEAGKTILFCSHSMYQIEAICNRVIWLNHGRVAMDGDPARVVSSYEDFLKKLERPEDTVGAGTVSLSGQEPRLTRVEVSVDGRVGKELTARSGLSDLTVTIEFLSNPRLAAPSVALTITDFNGWAVASASSHNDRLVLEPGEERRCEVQVRFPRLPLLKGHYWLNVFLLCDQALHLYDSAERVAAVLVEQEGLEQGLVSLPREWRIRGESYSPQARELPERPLVTGRQLG
ncbi:MAG: ABC transporter ATP-binding protein [Gallionella sp.]|jgi:lipopolysaccharide transport system ATP-binding protein